MNYVILTKPMILFLRLISIEVILILVLYSFNLLSAVADKKVLDKLSGDIKTKRTENLCKLLIFRTENVLLIIKNIALYNSLLS